MTEPHQFAPPSPEQLAGLTDAELERVSFTGIIQEQHLMLQHWPRLVDVGQRIGLLQALAGLAIGSSVTLWFGPLPVLVAVVLLGIPLAVWSTRGLRRLRTDRARQFEVRCQQETIMHEVLRRQRDEKQVH